MCRGEPCDGMVMSVQSDGHHSRPHIRELAPGEMDEDETDSSHTHPPLVEEPGKASRG